MLFRSDTPYNIEFVTTSINGIKKSIISNPFFAESNLALDKSNELTPIVTLNQEEGCVEITATPPSDFSPGIYLVKRTSDKNNFNVSEVIHRCIINGPNHWSWKDFTIENGYTYKYFL